MGIAERRDCYGRDDFKKDRRGIAYHIERTALCGVDDIETVMHRAEIVPAVVGADCKGGTILHWYSSRRLGKEAEYVEIQVF